MTRCTCRSQNPYAGRTPNSRGRYSATPSGGTAFASDAGCPPGTVSFTSVNVTSVMSAPGEPTIVLAYSGSPRTGTGVVRFVPVTFAIVMPEMCPGGGLPGQLPRPPSRMNTGLDTRFMVIPE